MLNTNVNKPLSRPPLVLHPPLTPSPSPGPCLPSLARPDSSREAHNAAPRFPHRLRLAARGRDIAARRQRLEQQRASHRAQHAVPGDEGVRTWRAALRALHVSPRALLARESGADVRVRVGRREERARRPGRMHEAGCVGRHG